MESRWLFCHFVLSSKFKFLMIILCKYKYALFVLKCKDGLRYCMNLHLTRFTFSVLFLICKPHSIKYLVNIIERNFIFKRRNKKFIIRGKCNIGKILKIFSFIFRSFLKPWKYVLEIYSLNIEMINFSNTSYIHLKSCIGKLYMFYEN